tara:strand:- start:18 stop:233 length:216 start_codon:yes stop_codon:yes gene_type:complete
MNYKVTYAIDSLDPNPTIKIFEHEYEAEEWLHSEVDRRINFTVEHCPYKLSDREIINIEESEYSLVRIEKL